MEKNDGSNENLKKLLDKLYGESNYDPLKADELKAKQGKITIEDFKKREAERLAKMADSFKNIPLPKFEPIETKMHNIMLATSKAILTMSYSFSKNLITERFNRIDLSDWKYSTNFLINYCNTFSISKSEEEQKKEILNSQHFSNTLQTLHNYPISHQTFTEIIEGNKPLISLGLSSASFFRKNLFFMILYVKNIEKKDVVGELQTKELATYWLKALVNYKMFSNFKACILLNRDYKKDIEANKLATIKHFNEVILGELENVLKEQSINSDWIRKIRATYKKLFDNRYETSEAVKKTAFPLFSREEIEMFIYILQYNISISETFPVAFEGLMNELLILEGISPNLLEGLHNEFSKLGGGK